MLKNSTSPLSDLQNLLQWLELPQTKECLLELQDKAETARLMALASPQAYNNVRDSGEINQLRNQFIGNLKGLTELQRILTSREVELREYLKLQEKKEQEKSQNG